MSREGGMSTLSQVKCLLVRHRVMNECAGKVRSLAQIGLGPPREVGRTVGRVRAEQPNPTSSNAAAQYELTLPGLERASGLRHHDL